MRILGVHKVDDGQYLVAFEGNKWVAIDNKKLEVDYENIAQNKTRAYLIEATKAILSA